MKFSERYGYTKPRTALQQKSMDDRLRNRLWNAVRNFLRSLGGEQYLSRNPALHAVMKRVEGKHFGRVIDELPFFTNDAIDALKGTYAKLEWHGIYDLIEYLSSVADDINPHWAYFGDVKESARIFRLECNEALTEEMSAFRFVDRSIAPITAEEEIAEIESALEHKGPIQPISQHVAAALDLLSRRENPDWRNSIKESISAVEAAARVLTGDEKATLGDALKVLDRDKKLHGAFNKAFSALYGYTSDADGIRHALLDDPDLDFHDAKFFLIACSAFANYLIGKKGAA
jgi:hypothetical protein